MPIYAYRCTHCGFKKDVLQKMSDAQLTLCPECKTEEFTKQVTAAGFQLKGSGWYATDFKGSNQPANEKVTGSSTESKSDASTPAPAATAAVTPAKPATETSPP